MRRITYSRLSLMTQIFPEAEIGAAQWQSLGRSVRELRRSHGLTLVDLAALVDLSQPFLSQVENGRARLSMKSLYRIAQALHVTPQSLFGNDEPTAKTSFVPASDERSIAFDPQTSQSACRMLLPGGAPFHVLEFLGLPAEFPNYYSHDGFEAVYVVVGNVDLDLDGVVTTMGPGDFMSYPSSVPHRLRSADPARVLLVESPHGASHDIGSAASV